MTRTYTTLLAVLAATAWLVVPGRAGAQDVYGHTPQNSPYRDVQSSSELSILAGYLDAAKDPAGVAPRSAPLIGLREMVHLGGPVMFFARLQHAFSTRTVIDPTSPAALRTIGPTQDGLTMLDTDLGINFTGDRSWHNLMPYFAAGPGVVSDLGASRDAGGYHFGTSFAIAYGGGIRWVTSGPLSIHASANMFMWTHHYPASYHAKAIDGTQVIPTGHNLSAWRNNGVFTLGVSYSILR